MSDVFLITLPETNQNSQSDICLGLDPPVLESNPTGFTRNSPVGDWDRYGSRRRLTPQLPVRSGWEVSYSPGFLATPSL